MKYIVNERYHIMNENVEKAKDVKLSGKQYDSQKNFSQKNRSPADLHSGSVVTRPMP